MKKEFWNSAATNGLILSLITILCVLISTLFTLPSVLSIALSVIKLVATWCMLYYAMKTYGKTQEFFPYNKAFFYGFSVSLCSAVITAVYYYFHFGYIFTDKTHEFFTAFMDGMKSAGGSSGIDTLAVGNNFPILMSIAMLFYLTIVGLIASAIMAAAAKQKEDITF